MNDEKNNKKHPRNPLELVEQVEKALKLTNIDWENFDHSNPTAGAKLVEVILVAQTMGNCLGVN